MPKFREDLIVDKALASIVTLYPKAGIYRRMKEMDKQEIKTFKAISPSREDFPTILYQGFKDLTRWPSVLRWEAWGRRASDRRIEDETLFLGLFDDQLVLCWDAHSKPLLFRATLSDQEIVDSIIGLAALTKQLAEEEDRYKKLMVEMLARLSNGEAHQSQ